MQIRKKRILVIDDQIGKAGNRERKDFIIDYKGLMDKYEFLYEDCEDGFGGYTSDEAIQSILDAGHLDLILLDIKFGSEEDRLGFEILERIRTQFRGLPVMMMSSLKRDVESLARSLEPGAISYITKRPKPSEFEKHIDDAIALSRDYAILGNSPAIRRLRHEIARVSPYENVPILILGERGTGKERVARYIHQNGPRQNGPFIGVNCAGLSAELLESELFGHLKGSFSGADRDRKGYLEIAKGGTLFLDEVGEIPIRVQITLLRVLEERKFLLVGESQNEKEMDVQIVSATNADPEKLIAIGELREDFYDRIAAFVINTPPLRMYNDDIAELADYFLKQAVPSQNKKFSNNALDCLKAYSWPGNGRELKNVVWRSAIKSENDPIIDIQFLPQTLISKKYSEKNGKSIIPKTPQREITFPAEAHKRANFLSQIILDILTQEAIDVSGNASAIMRDLFPGQTGSKRYLGQVAWKLVDWNPWILHEPTLRKMFEENDVLWSSFTSYLSANPMTRRKLSEKLHRFNIQLPNFD